MTTPKQSNGNRWYGVGIEAPKRMVNTGSLWRTATSFDASFMFTIGARYQRQAADTVNSPSYMPYFRYDSVEDFRRHIPYDCLVIGVELTDDAADLVSFDHPRRCIYLLGAEDHGLSKAALNLCQAVVQIPSRFCLNVAVAGSIVIYDRIAKQRPAL